MALTDNLRAWFKFDELSGNIADSSGSGIGSLLNINSTPFVSGKIGNAADLSNESSQCFQGGSPTLTYTQIGGDMTAQMWIYPHEAHFNEGAGGIGYINNESVGDWMLSWGNQNLYIYDRPTAGSWRASLVGSGNFMSLNAWYHCVFRRSGGTVTVWVNGTSQPLTSGTASTGWGTSHFIIGQFYPDPGYTFDGLIDLAGVLEPGAFGRRDRSALCQRRRLRLSFYRWRGGFNEGRCRSVFDWGDGY